MAGDCVDGDGYGDLLVTDEYRVWLYPGGPSGIAAAPTLFLAADTALVNVLTGLGDVDGDGYADIGVGVTTADSGGVNQGGVLVYRGGPSGLSAPVSLLVPLYAAGIRAIGADVNGDGFGDLVTEGCKPGTPLGCVAFFYPGGPGGLATPPSPSTSPRATSSPASPSAAT